MTTAVDSKVTRLHIRTSPSQKALLARAARARHLNVSQFVLQACLEAAEKAVQEEKARDAVPEVANVLKVSAAEYNWLLQKLEEAPQDNPALRRLLSEAPTWNG